MPAQYSPGYWPNMTHPAANMPASFEGVVAVVKQLQNAATLIRRNGWRRGALRDDQDRRCVDGAILCSGDRLGVGVAQVMDGVDAFTVLGVYLSLNRERYFYPERCVATSTWNDECVPTSQGATLVPEALDGAALWLASMDPAEIHGTFS